MLSKHISPDLQRGWTGLISTVVSAGRAARCIQRRGTSQADYSRKSDDSPVTLADQEVERQIHAYVQDTWPRAIFLGEEFGEQPLEGEHGEDDEQRENDDQNAGAGLRFIVDPIDGTRAFIRDIPTWSVLVGVEFENRVIGGIAFLPVDDDLFIALEGQGTTHNGRPCRVSNVDALSGAMVAAGGLGQFTDAGYGRSLLRIAKAAYSTRAFGDFANYRELLLGRVDAVVDPGVEVYDIAPVDILVREAGGQVSDMTGAETIRGSGFFASNGLLHGAIQTLLIPDG